MSNLSLILINVRNATGVLERKCRGLGAGLLTHFFASPPLKMGHLPSQYLLPEEMVIQSCQPTLNQLPTPLHCILAFFSLWDQKFLRKSNIFAWKQMISILTRLSIKIEILPIWFQKNAKAQQDKFFEGLGVSEL